MSKKAAGFGDNASQQVQEQSAKYLGGVEISGYVALTRPKGFPSNWREVSTADTFKQISTNIKKVKTKECQAVGKYPVIDQGQLDVAGFVDDISRIIEVTRPLVIFGDHTRIIKWVNSDFVPGADGTKVLEAVDFIEPRYFYYQLKSIELPDKGYSRHFRYLNETSFRVAPIAEQQQIAAKLDELLAQVDSVKTRLDAIPKILKRFRQSVLAAAVSGKLTADIRKINEYTKLHGVLLPSSWKVKQAQDVCKKVQSGSTPRDNPFDQDGAIPFLKVYNIVDQKINFDYKPQFVTKETHEKSLKRSIALPNDVLMNIVGPPLGKVALLTDQYSEWNLNQAITLFRANQKHLQFNYLY